MAPTISSASWRRGNLEDLSEDYVLVSSGKGNLKKRLLIPGHFVYYFFASVFSFSSPPAGGGDRGGWIGAVYAFLFIHFSNLAKNSSFLLEATGNSFPFSNTTSPPLPLIYSLMKERLMMYLS